MLGETGSPSFASGGTSAVVPHLHPDQIGFSGSPCSNSTHTPAPMGGTMYTPIGGPVGPASGTHGNAHEEGSKPTTSGTITCKRPINSGSMLLVTVPRNLP